MNIHILGIAGSMTTPLALFLKQQGHIITGSDQGKIFPPTSELLKNIPLNQPLSKKIDLCIVGSSFNKFQKTKEEFKFIHDNHIPYISATNFISNHISQTNSVLVAGTYGKTSISSLLAWNLYQAKLNPSYFFGGTAINDFPSLQITDSDWSVSEADESINGLDKQAKFLYYPVKFLIITSASWEHKESYTSNQDNFEAFKKLIQKVPVNGLIIANKKGENIKKLLKFSQAPVIYYDQNNEKAVELFCKNINIKFDNKFPGIKRRLELIKEKNNILIFDDFAQSVPRIKYVINTLQHLYPEYNLKVLFEPHASFLKHSIKNLGSAFAGVNEIVLSSITYGKDKNKRITINDYRREIGSKLIYLPLKSDIINHYQKTLKPFDLLVRFSSGGENICQNI